MENKNLLIVFVKNPIKGKVKTRLAEAIGNEQALQVYKKLISITEKVTLNAKSNDLHVYFSDFIEENLWERNKKYIQKGSNLGERMLHAFQEGFKLDYNKILLIGSDLPDLSAEIIQKGFDALDANDLVFGPAKDGGYYLVGMKVLHHEIFKNKPWSTPNLLEVTLKQLDRHKSVFYLTELNDIDEYEDLNHPKFTSYKNCSNV